MSIKRSLKIILVHGMFADMDQLEPFAKHFREFCYDVILISLCGHYPGGNVSQKRIGDYVKYVNAIVQSAGPCVLIGHSMGGLIVQKVAEGECAKNIKGVVTVCSAAPKGISALTWGIIWRIITTPTYMLSMFTGNGYYIKPQHAKDLMLNDMPEADPMSLFPSMESGFATKELAYSQIEVGAIKCPMLVVGAELDRMTPLRIQTAIREMQNAVIMTYPCGHMAPIGKFARGIAIEIHDWIKKFCH